MFLSLHTRPQIRVNCLSVIVTVTLATTHYRQQKEEDIQKGQHAQTYLRWKGRKERLYGRQRTTHLQSLNVFAAMQQRGDS